MPLNAATLKPIFQSAKRLGAKTIGRAKTGIRAATPIVKRETSKVGKLIQKYPGRSAAIAGGSATLLGAGVLATRKKENYSNMHIPVGKMIRAAGRGVTNATRATGNTIAKHPKIAAGAIIGSTTLHLTTRNKRRQPQYATYAMPKALLAGIGGAAVGAFGAHTAHRIRNWRKTPKDFEIAAKNRAKLLSTGKVFDKAFRDFQAGKISTKQFNQAGKPFDSALKNQYALQEAFETYGTKDFWNGWSVGVRDGNAEAAGTQSPPGALRLSYLRARWGNGYVLGRQHALANMGLSGGTKGGKGYIDLAHTLLEKVKTNSSSEQVRTYAKDRKKTMKKKFDFKKFLAEKAMKKTGKKVDKK